MEFLNKLKDNRSFAEQFPHLRKEDYCDHRVQPYVLDRFPAGCDVMSCMRYLNTMFETTRFGKFEEAYLKMEEYKIEPYELIRRLSDNHPDTLAWYTKGVRGSINEGYFYAPYDPRVLHSYTNVPAGCEILSDNVHVAVGFTDLSVFFNTEYSDKWTKKNPLKWVGYEASAYCVAKTAIIVAMLEIGEGVDAVVQVWFSAAWSYSTLNAFRNAINYLQNSKYNILEIPVIFIN